MKETINIALLGMGTVGSGVYQVLNRHRGDFKLKVGADLRLKWILEKDRQKIEQAGVSPDLIAADFTVIAKDPEVDIIVELFGGIEPARSYILEAIGQGKNIVTANKELLANHGKKLLEAADSHGVDLCFEASVGGGIPIIHPLKQCLVGNKILRVMGIVNGTTNFILTRMEEDGCSFEQALREAQEKGYAEREPTADLEGYDAAAKLAILASIAFNSRVTAADVYREGISRVTAKDIEYARELGCVIKLLAIAKEENGGLEVRVHPTMLSKDHPLASVKWNYNAIFVVGDAVGEVMFYGQGAGSLPAASAVVGDIIDVARNIQYQRTSKISCTCFETKRIKPISELQTCYYLLLNANDRPGVLAKIAQAFGNHQVSLAKIIQKETRDTNADLMFITHKVSERDLRGALEDIERLDVVNSISNLIRVEGLENG